MTTISQYCLPVFIYSQLSIHVVLSFENYFLIFITDYCPPYCDDDVSKPESELVGPLYSSLSHIYIKILRAQLNNIADCLLSFLFTLPHIPSVFIYFKHLLFSIHFPPEYLVFTSTLCRAVDYYHRLYVGIGFGTF